MLVMYGGSVVESGPTAQVFERLAHPYTRGLFGARPRLGSARPGGRKAALATIPGRVPELADLPRGCPFADRCAWAIDACRVALPAALAVPPASPAVQRASLAAPSEAPAVRRAADAGAAPGPIAAAASAPLARRATAAIHSAPAHVARCIRLGTPGGPP